MGIGLKKANEYELMERGCKPDKEFYLFGELVRR